MFRKINLKTIIILFVVLLAIVIITTITGSMKGNRSFKGNLTGFNADQIDKIVISPKVMNGKKIEISKNNDRWELLADGRKFNADQRLAESLVNELDQIKPKSVASTKKERWADYQVTDSLGTRVQLYSGNTVLEDIYLGKFSFSGGGATSYVRLANDKTTYGIAGSQSSMANRNADGFKDKTVINSEKEEWDKITFSYPGDSSFFIGKQGDKWNIGDIETDSVKIAGFLSSLSTVNHYKLASTEPSENPQYSVKIEGKKLTAPIEVNGYRQNDLFIVSTSQNPGIFFEGKDLMKKLYPSKSRFAKTAPPKGAAKHDNNK